MGGAAGIIAPVLGLAGSLFGSGGDSGGGQSGPPQFATAQLPPEIQQLMAQMSPALQGWLKTREDYMKGGGIGQLFPDGSIPKVDPFGSEYGKTALSSILGGMPQGMLSAYMANQLAGDQVPGQRLMGNLMGGGVQAIPGFPGGGSSMPGGPPMGGGQAAGRRPPMGGGASLAGMLRGMAPGGGQGQGQGGNLMDVTISFKQKGPQTPRASTGASRGRTG